MQVNVKLQIVACLQSHCIKFLSSSPTAYNSALIYWLLSSGHKRLNQSTVLHMLLQITRQRKLQSKSYKKKNGSQPVFQSASRSLQFIWETRDACSTTTSIPGKSCWISSLLSKPSSPPGPLRPGSVSRKVYGHCAACSFCDRRSTDWSSARLPGLLHLYHAVLLFTSGHCCTDLLHLCKYISFIRFYIISLTFL